MTVQIPFLLGAGTFSVLNACASTYCWYLTRRQILLWSGAVNSLIGVIAIAAYSSDAKFANTSAAVAALSALAQFTLHKLRNPVILCKQRYVYHGYTCWMSMLLMYFLYEAACVYQIRFD